MDSHKLASMITDEVSAATDGEGIAAKDFCSIWANTKPILGFIGPLLAIVPGYGTSAFGALQGLIKVGDQIASEVCPK